MKLFDDYKVHGSGLVSDKQAVKDSVDYINKLYSQGQIKDIMFLIRSPEGDIGKYDLPQNMHIGLTVDTEYEVTVFMRMAVDSLLDRMKQATVQDFVKKIKGERKENE